MKTIKFFVFASAVGMAACASAQYTSPELILVADGGGYNEHNEFVTPQVDRYDPFTGQFLGGFGAGFLHDPRSIVVVGQDAYVSDVVIIDNRNYSKIVKFNFSTGAFEGSMFSASAQTFSGLAKFGANILASDLGTEDTSVGGGMFTFDAGGNVAGAQPLPDGSFAQAISADASHAYIATSGGAGLYSYNLNAQGVSTGLNFVAGAGKTFYGTATLGNRIFAAGKGPTEGLLVEYNSAGAQVDICDAPGTGTFGSLAFGHNGVLYSVGAIDGGFWNHVFVFDANQPLFLGPSGIIDLDRTGFARSIAVYAAPEPFSIAGLAVGVLAMLRRRKKA